MSLKTTGVRASMAIAALAIAPSGAGAQEVLSLQAQAMRGGFTLPAAAGTRSAACMVDTGVDASALDVRPDLAYATSGGVPSAGPAAGPKGPVMHGTWMVQYATAPQDGRGMVGPTPGVPFIAVRALPDGTENFTTEQYIAGARTCREVAQARGLRLASVALALGADGASATETLNIATAVSDLPVPVFAAAGNRPGVPQFPAAASGVIAVAAASAVDGTKCSTSADADAEAEGVVGVGCLVTMPLGGEVQSVVSAGTSGASVSMAAAVAQVCDWAGLALTPHQCWQRVRDTARPVAAGRLPDLAAAARSLGLTPPAITVPAATLIPATSTAAAGPTSSSVSIGPPTPGAGIEIQVTTPPSWYRLGYKPRVRRLAGGRVKVISADRLGNARLWTSLRGARVGSFESVTGRLGTGKRSVRVRVTQRTADGTTYERTWTLTVPKATPRL